MCSTDVLIIYWWRTSQIFAWYMLKFVHFMPGPAFTTHSPWYGDDFRITGHIFKRVNNAHLLCFFVKNLNTLKKYSNCWWFEAPRRLCAITVMWPQDIDGIWCDESFRARISQEGLQPMMASSNGNIFRVTCHLCGEFTGHRWLPLTKASDADFDVFFELRTNKRLSKQSFSEFFQPNRAITELQRHTETQAHPCHKPHPFLLKEIS